MPEQTDLDIVLHLGVIKDVTSVHVLLCLVTSLDEPQYAMTSINMGYSSFFIRDLYNFIWLLSEDLFLHYVSIMHYIWGSFVLRWFYRWLCILSLDRLSVFKYKCIYILQVYEHMWVSLSKYTFFVDEWNA